MKRFGAPVGRFEDELEVAFLYILATSDSMDWVNPDIPLKEGRFDSFKRREFLVLEYSLDDLNLGIQEHSDDFGCALINHFVGSGCDVGV